MPVTRRHPHDADALFFTKPALAHRDGGLPLFSGIPRRLILGNSGVYPLSKKRYYGNVESYPQQREHHNDQPPNHTTYDANKYGDEVDGNRWRNDQVRQEQEYHPNHAIDAQPHQSGF